MGSLLILFQHGARKKYYLFKRYGLNNLGGKSIHAFVVLTTRAPLDKTGGAGYTKQAYLPQIKQS